MAQIRTLYRQASADENKATALIGLLERQDPPSFILKGYKGAVMMVMAKHTHNPYAKLRYFNEGKAILEVAIAGDPNNAELHFLRYSIQVNAPAFLGYNQHIEADRLFLLKSIPAITDIQLKIIIQSLLNSNTSDKS